MLYKPIFRCQMCGAFGGGDLYTSEQVDDILDKMAQGKAGIVVKHFCKNGALGIMNLEGFIPYDEEEDKE